MSVANTNVRELALRLLTGAWREGRYVNLLLNTPEAKRLSKKDRSFLTLLLYTATERSLAYDYAICALSGRSLDKISEDALFVLRLGLCQIYDIKSVPPHAAVNETVKLVKSGSIRSFVNAILREAVRRGEAPLPPKEKNFLRYLSVKHSLPLPLVRHYRDSYGEEGLEALVTALTEKKPLSLTVNTKKTSRISLLRELSDCSATPSPISENGITVSAPTSPTELPHFSEGHFFVQDEASRLAVEALSLRAGESCVDVCAAPGGKSFLAAMQVGDAGRVLSLELHESKLSLIRDGAMRLSLDNITVGCRDATAPDTALASSFDALICDVPCSGLGVIGKKPDLRYKDLSGIGKLPPLQYEILEKSVGYLRAGGRLVYSTCTLNPEENESVTDRFITEHPDFAYESFTLGGIYAKDGRLTLLPHIHNTDGFYIALIRKKK
ncbi:MAG: 16S rRNA (cytosine(967)-C(5))-methyltransferase RsmB [Clostridia bacterium]|nr:16S rRNA (cytosine(967)-C(5))-methyltransferase RsmB [Clostridia bacterium]